MTMNLDTEIKRRRTFAIISHPDAGKTTLTEKLLLFGGAIHVAGAIKAKKAGRYTTSDFMEIEKQRGISVATSVMGFHYNGFKIGLLDTPGHKDFSEDTYRTLTAVDSVMMVIDYAKGVEPQTHRLMEVCRMRETPIMTFINKLDREGPDAIQVLDEIEEKLKIKVCPMTWPIGSGKGFKGVYDLIRKQMILFKPHQTQSDQNAIQIQSVDDERLVSLLGLDYQRFKEEVQLVEGVYPSFDLSAYLKGKLTPVFFGSALNNFGIKELLDQFLEISPPPQERETTHRVVKPQEDKFTGFVFKIHANMDPKHRDRIAFLRICSGVFERGKKYINTRSKKELKFSTPTAFMAQDKMVIDTAYPGDVIGLHDTQQFKIGDTLTEGELVSFKGIPHFSPEIFKIVVNLDPLKTKQLEKGLSQLCEEGVAQLFIQKSSQRRIVGTVGALQFEVIQYRLEHEYGALCRFDSLDFMKACWIFSEDDGALKEFMRSRSFQIASDQSGHDVYMAQTQWSLEREIKENPKIDFKFFSDL